jgi:hypothetical protein
VGRDGVGDKMGTTDLSAHRDGDSWLGADKLAHALGCAVAVLAALLALHRWQAAGPGPVSCLRLVYAFLISLAFGLLKEWGDHAQWWAGDASGRDLLADGLGAALGCMLVWGGALTRYAEAWTPAASLDVAGLLGGFTGTCCCSLRVLQ